MKIHLIIYGDDNYTPQREKLQQSAFESSFFDEVTLFTPQDLDADFANQFKEILQIPNVGGYWIWKPYFMRRVLDSLDDGDILIYCDAGCTINPGGRERFNQYINMLSSSETGIIAFELDYKAYLYTKQEVFNYFDSSDEVVNSNLICAGIIMFKKCKHSSLIVDKWLKTVYDDHWLFSDILDEIPRHEKFIKPRHDQSIYSAIINTYGAEIIPDESYFKDFKTEGAKFPFWATRSGNNRILYYIIYTPI